MKITISKILNKTDLAESKSHGGLVVPKNAQKMLLDFFENPGVEHKFVDKTNLEEYEIHYKDYTSNGTTPNDRITPIGKYAGKHGLCPGDNLIFQKVEDNGSKKYYIEYLRKLNSAYFVGKSNTSVEALNYEQFFQIVTNNVSAGLIKKNSPTSCEMRVRYHGIEGKMVVTQTGDTFELCFNDKHIEENNKYFELDTSVNPFELRKTDTWKLELSMGTEDEEIDANADEEFVRDISINSISIASETYVARPEEKKNPKHINGKIVPNRDRQRAVNALARAGHRCEYDESHELFVRRSQPINYTEPHHLIPLRFDELFENSLDVEANIVSLCSNCHNLIHYGADAEKVIRKLWEKSEKELRAAGLDVMRNGVELTIDILLSFYGIR